MLSLDPYSLEEVFATFLAVGARAGVPERGKDLVGRLRDRLARVETAVARHATEIDGRRVTSTTVAKR